MQKIILITGASSGIGKALAEQMAGKGQTLLLVARNMAALEKIRETCERNGAEVQLFNADLSQKREVELLAEKINAAVPYLSVLVNNAGISQRSQAENTAEQVDRDIMELNFFSPVRLTKLLWPLFLKAEKANIVNISSVTGTFGFPQRSAYAASKHALEGFFESWMLENKHLHIHFTTVAPGRILTNISYNALKGDGSKHQEMDKGQEKGISAEKCAKKIITAIERNRRKVFIVKEERILLIAYRFFPSFFVYMVKKTGIKIMQQLISGIQQIGIGIPDAESYFTWFRKAFGFDVKIFDDEAHATLMTRYTGGEIHSRRAILAMNMNGGGGAEIWQFTSRETTFPGNQLHIGDLGINAVKIKCSDVPRAFEYLATKVDCSELFISPSGDATFWIRDEYGNLFEIVKNCTFFKKKPYMMGGMAGAMIGVSNMDQSMKFYRECLGVEKVIYDETGCFNDLGEANKNRQFRRVLLSFTNQFSAPFSKLLGHVDIELIQALDRVPVKTFENRFWGDGGFIHLCFDVSNMNALKERMKSNAIEFTVDSADTFDMGKAGGRFAYAEDPDGTLIEMVETHKVPIFKKIGWYLDLKKRGQHKPLPDWMIRALGLNRVRD